MNYQTFLAKPLQIPQRWWLVDASDLVMGRLAVKLATILIGKNKPEYTPHADVGDYVVVTNVEKIRMTGRKIDQKFFETYSGYPGGHKLYSYRWMLENRPETLLEVAVRRMMPKNKLAARQILKLKLYRGGEHPHSAQQPAPLALSL